MPGLRGGDRAIRVRAVAGLPLSLLRRSGLFAPLLLLGSFHLLDATPCDRHVALLNTVFPAPRSSVPAMGQGNRLRITYDFNEQMCACAQPGVLFF